MNDDHKIDSQAKNQAHQEQNHVLITDINFEFDARSSPQQSMGPWVQQDIDHHHHHQQSRQSSTIMSRFESPTLAFYATERCMGFPQYESQVSNFNTDINPSLSSQFSPCSSQSYPIICDSLDQQTQPNFEFTNSIQQPNNINPFLGHVNSTNTSTTSTTTNSTPSITRQISLNSKQNQDIGGYSSSFGSPFSQLSFVSSHQYNNHDRQSSRFASGNDVLSVSTINHSVSNNNGHAISSKARIRWTQDLHEKFVECVNRLGGSEKATPKAILRLMESDGLTIFHVKSHLQKYRIAKYLPDSSEGKYDKRACIDATPQFESTTGLQIKEALQLQLDVQRRLHEQLEIQRTLQLQIEEQGKQLKMMFDMQQRTRNSLGSDISSLDEAPSNSIDEVSLPETSGNNTHFHSKIS